MNYSWTFPSFFSNLYPALCGVLLALGASVPLSVDAMEHLTIEREGTLIFLSGRVECEAADGGLLLLARDGTLWAIQPDEIRERQRSDAPVSMLDSDELTAQILSELPEGFEVHQTAHYLIFHDTSKAYAEWYGALYERLYRGFFNYWRKRGLGKIAEPATPLVAIVFDNRSAYIRYSKGELGNAAEVIVGYYSLRSNRVITYDLTEQGELRDARGRPKSAGVVNEILSKPQAHAMVATIIHEATHQLAYNCQLQTRYADNPLWLSEGLAIYFETPDLRNSKGWRNIGKLNPIRLSQLQKRLASGRSFELRSLLADDNQLRDADTAMDGYARAWALCFYLAKRRPEAFASYLAELAELKPLQTTSTEERLFVFRRHFGDDLSGLEKEVERYFTRR